MTGWLPKTMISLGCAAGLGLCAAPPSLAAGGRVYWSSEAAPPDAGVSFANLDGSGGAPFNSSGAMSDRSGGVAIDVRANTIYWANYGNSTISRAKLTGGGGSQISFTGVTPSGPYGLAIDPIGHRLYWADYDDNRISYANLDGSGGGHLNTGTAAVSSPSGLALDLAAGKVFWSNGNDNAHPVSYARLNGSGGGNVNTGSLTGDIPNGLAIDPVDHRLYWANYGNNTISYVSLNGSGAGGQLSTTGAVAAGVQGIAIDHKANRLYWGNYSDGSHPIGYANLNDTGGGSLNTSPLVGHGAGFPAVLKPPAPAGAPAITGGSSRGSKLSCSHGRWAADVLDAFLFQAPRSFTYSWSRNGTPLNGLATRSITASAAGHYRCVVRANNRVGNAAQHSAVHIVK